jgi:hypothetical protein
LDLKINKIKNKITFISKSLQITGLPSCGNPCQSNSSNERGLSTNFSFTSGSYFPITLHLLIFLFYFLKKKKKKKKNSANVHLVIMKWPELRVSRDGRHSHFTMEKLYYMVGLNYK